MVPSVRPLMAVSGALAVYNGIARLEAVAGSEGDGVGRKRFVAASKVFLPVSVAAFLFFCPCCGCLGVGGGGCGRVGDKGHVTTADMSRRWWQGLRR